MEVSFIINICNAILHLFSIKLTSVTFNIFYKKNISIGNNNFSIEGGKSIKNNIS